MYKSKPGFTLIELVITIVILGILASIAIPAYFNYTRRSYFAEIIQAIAPYKTSVVDCFQQTADLSQCNAGSHKIPAAITTKTGAVASLTVTGGVITVTPVPARGVLETDTYILTPAIVNNNIAWTASGAGAAHLK